LRSQPVYKIVYAVCISTENAESFGVYSTFVITEPGRAPDTTNGVRFKVWYLDGNKPIRSVITQTPVLSRFEEGDRSFWVTSEDKDGKHQVADNFDLLRREVLPNPYNLIHVLTNKEVGLRSALMIFPNEITTHELAGVVARGLRLKTAEERAAFIRKESDTKNKSVKEYLDWLAKRDKK